MIQTNAGRIDPAGIGPRADKFSETVADIRSIRYGKPVEHWLEAWCRGLPQRTIGDIADRGFLRLYQAQTFIRKEEEGFPGVLADSGNQNRPAQSTSEIVLAKRRLGQREGIVEPIVRIEHV